MIRVGKGRSAVMIDGPLADGLEKQIRELLGPVAVKMQEEADAIVAKAQSEWPVGNQGTRSRDAFYTALTVIPGTFRVEVSVINTAPYTRYIKSTKVGKADDATRIRSPLQTLVAKPARAVTRLLKKELPAILAAALNNDLEG